MYFGRSSLCLRASVAKEWTLFVMRWWNRIGKSWWWLLLLVCVQVCAEQLPLKLYTTADGLAHETVNLIRRDSHGFLWFGTVDGLSRFDGYRFANYSTKDGLPHNTIYDLLESRSGVYWLATPAGVTRFAPAQASRTAKQQLFQTFPLQVDQKNVAATCLNEDQAGQLWAGTLSGLFRLIIQGAQVRPERVALRIPGHREETVEVLSITDDGAGSTWVATGFGLVRLLPDGRRKHYPVNPHENMDMVWALLRDAQGRIWASHYSGGLFVLKPEPPAQVKTDTRELDVSLEQTALKDNLSAGRVLLPENPGEVRSYTVKDGLAGTHIRAMCLTASGHVWLGARNGAVISFDGIRFQNYTEGLTRRVTALAEDAAGNLWVGARSGGVLRLAKHGFLTFRVSDGLGLDDVLKLTADRTGVLTVIHNGWVISQLNAAGGGPRFQSVTLNLPKRIAESSVGNREMQQDHLGDWWVATGLGVARFSGVTTLADLARVPPRIYTLRDGLADDNVNRIFADSRGDIWACSYHPPVTLARWQRATQTWVRYGEAEGLPANNWPNRVAEDKAGNVWFGMHQGGAVRWRKGRFEYFGEESGLPLELVQGIHVDRSGRLWIGTKGRGAARCDDPAADHPQFTVYNVEQGLGSDVVWSFAQDRWGRAYFAHARGVDRLELTSGRIKHFTEDDGLARGEVLAAFADQQGALWFGTREGLSYLAPDERDEVPLPPPVVISGLRIAGQPHAIAELGESAVRGLRLEPHQNQLELDFFGLNFALGTPPRYQYFFEGLDRDWSPPSEQRTVAANFATGDYRFRVRAVSLDANGFPVAGPEATLGFTVLPPIWRRWWFLSLGGLALIGLGYLGHRYNVARVVELERVRTRIATDLHDDIGASLSRMAILSEVVKQVNGHNPQSAQMLTEIADSARGLVDSMSDIVWAIDPRRDDLQQVVARTRQFAADVFEAQGVHWVFEVPPATEQAFAKIKLAPEQRRHLYLIFKESINNAAKYSSCRSFAIKLHVQPQQLHAEIQDDGCGFDWQPAQAKPVLLSKSRGGNGLQNMQARAAELGGTLQIETAPGRGTSLRLTMPLK
jgi:ligand-binding sensor domain-containing protein/signal transduction histidine kinase